MRLFILIFALLAMPQISFAEPPDFQRDILPVLKERCLACHGPDDSQSGLSVESLGHLKLGGDRAIPVVPGKAEESLLYQVLIGKSDIARMPLDDDPLTDAQLELVQQWIDAGAPGWQETKSAQRVVKSDHWSFQPIVSPAIPPVKHSDLVRNPIDNFVLQRLEQEQIEPSPAAARTTLIRRLSLDLLGLLPKPQEVTQFVNDTDPEAYEKLVDRLLSSKHFGERWGRHWLDAARYADSNGYTIDGARSIWPYRDWVVDAFNRNLPFDQFAIEQLAGDLLPEPTQEQLIATGFHRNTLINEEGGTDDEQFRVESIVDRVSTTGTVFLGLTVGCAQCHTHKFDPITQREFYEMFAVFNQCDEPNLELPTPAQAKQKKSLSTQLADAKKALKAYENETEKQANATALTEFKNWHDTHESFWDVIALDKVSAIGMTRFEKLNDESWLAKDPEIHETYILEFNTPEENPRAIRLEALIHDSIKSKGPGLTDHGNFTLNEVTVETEDGTPIKIVRAQADHFQAGGEDFKAIDGDPETFWAINASKELQHSDREIQLFLDPETNLPAGTKLIVKLRQSYSNSPYLIGRFRLSMTTALDAFLHIPLLSRRKWERAEKWDDKFNAEIETELNKLDPERNRLQSVVASRVADLKNLNTQIDKTMILRKRAQARETHIHVRGDFLRQGAPVEPNVLAVLHDPQKTDQPLDRLSFARWMMSPENPLTARVTVNRFWQRFFGLGLVATENDFGTQGDNPSHPELLDWLSNQFISSGWNVKQTLKTIVMSHTYRQSSVQHAELLARDPRNRLLARQSRVRLDAEVIRDIALDASGLLSEKMGGPGVYPPQPDGIYVLTQVKKNWATDTDEDRYRRGLYTYLWRSSPYPFLTTFDAPSPTMACTRRTRSNTPLQALTLANDVAFVETARALAQRVLTEGPDYDEGRIRYAWNLCYSREPSSEELTLMTKFVQKQRDALDDSKKMDAILAQSVSEIVPKQEQAAWVMTARVLINLDEFITRE